LGELIASNPNVKYIFEASDTWELGGTGENESHRLTAQHATGPVKQQIREWFEKQVGDAGILVEKSPRNSLRVPYVKEIFPEARFIHIVRDGRDVACSMVPGCGGTEWKHLKPPSWQKYLESYSGAIRCAYVWKETLEIAMKDLSIVPHLQLHYEDLIQFPERTAGKILDFLGLDLHPATLEFCQKISNTTLSSYQAKYQDHWYQDNHSRRVGRWQENLNDEEKLTINQLLQPLLTELGYINEQDIDKVKSRPSAENAVLAGRKLVVVLGVHRSGTSVVTRGLQVMGVELRDRLMPAVSGNNDKGFWEDIDINALNIEALNFLNSDWHFLAPIEPSQVEALQRAGFLNRAIELLAHKTSDTSIFGFKDPRVTRLLPFWKQVFTESHLNVSYVLTLRHPLSVSQSLTKRDGFDDEKNHLLWLGHMITCLAGTIGEKCIVVDYDHLMQSPDSEINRMADLLQLQIDTQKLEEYKTGFLDEQLRHTVYLPRDLMSDDAVPPLLLDVYFEVLKLSHKDEQTDSESFRNKVDIWLTEFSKQKSTLVLVDKLTLRITSLNRILDEKEQYINEKEQYINAKELQLDDLSWHATERENRLKEIYSSRSWKLIEAIRKIRVGLLAGHQR
jgi:hypothetical protein